MAIKKYKPTTPSRRKASVVKAGLTVKKPEKKLTRGVKNKAGRSRGKITVRHRGSGHKRKYRTIDFKQQRFDLPAKVLALEYDPNRSAYIALVQYQNGEKSYILAPEGLKIDEEVVASRKKVSVKTGNRMSLKYIPVGMMVFNVELVLGKGGEIVRSAGSHADILSQEENYTHLKLPSGEIRMVPKDCLATIGQVSNVEHSNIRIGKAGRTRWMRKRPTVRGKAMNPHDHPHGGGEGGQPIGLKNPKTPWGKPALGYRTRKKDKKSDKFIVRRRK